MYLGREGVLRVKFSKKGKEYWRGFRVSRSRTNFSITEYFRGIPEFRFAILYSFNRKTRKKGIQLGYFDKHKGSGFFY